MASVETDFAAKTATVTMRPDKALGSEQVARAFEGSKYSLAGVLEPLDGAASGR